MRVDEVVTLVMRDRVFYEESEGGVTLSGGEPLTQPQFTIELWESFGMKGIHRTLDTSGYADLDLFRSVLSLTDWVLFDIKAASKELHLFCTGTSNERILRNLAYLDRMTTIPYAIRIPIIFGMNDGEENRKRTIQILEGLDRMDHIQLMPYHSWGTGKARKIGIAQDTFDTAASEQSSKQWLIDLRKKGFPARRNGGEDNDT
jgi:pyruvate formate lyase activating enzyme